MHCVLLVAGKEGFGGDNCTDGTYRDGINIRTHNTGVYIYTRVNK